MVICIMCLDVVKNLLCGAHWILATTQIKNEGLDVDIGMTT